MPLQTTLHSSVVGGSTAARVIACPGSVPAVLSLPKGIDVPSEYAEEGTALHAVMAELMTRRGSASASRRFNPYREMRKLIGHKFHDRDLTAEHCDTMVQPALEALEELEREYGGGFNVVGIEQVVKFPGLPSAFGTMDLLLASDRYIIHLDWKFGAGVPVPIAYTDGTINHQIMYYTTGSRATLRHLYRNSDGRPRTMVGAIIQPRVEEPLGHAVITGRALGTFKSQLIGAVDAALAGGAQRVKGEHCRWAPCKLTCPLWTGPLLDLTAIKPVKSDSPSVKTTPYGEYLAKAKVLVDMAAMFKKEIDEQMHAYLDAGGSIPGWRLKHKTTQRKWIEEAVVEKALKKLGFKSEEIWQQKLVTFSSADATAKRRNVEIPDHLRVAPPTSETTVATTDDPAPVVERALAMDQFRASLRALGAK